MTDSSSPPPEPPNKPPAPPRRIPRAEATPPEPEGRDKPHVGQRVMEQRPHERKPTEHAAARGKKPDLRDLPPPRRDTPSNVWRADPPPASPRDRRDGPRRAYGDAPRPDRPGERRTSPGPWQERGPRPGFVDSRPPEFPAPRESSRKDDRHAGGPPRQDRRRDDRHPTGHGNDRGGPIDERAVFGDRDRPRYPQGPNERPRSDAPREDHRRFAGDRPRPPQGDRRPPGPNDRPPPRRRDDFEREAAAQPRPPQQPPFDPNAPRREDQRLSKVLAERGIASRREADDWIDAGWVKVDGVPAVLGARVFPHQTIEIDEAARTQQAHRVTILLHKPIGYVSGQAEDGYEPAVVLVTQANHWPEDPSRERWHFGHARGLAPAGRLDIDSTGLLVLTQDGRIARHLIGDDSDVEKEYLVRVEYPRGGQFPDTDLDRLRHGLWLDGRELRPAKVSWANEDQLRFVLREGRKRQIRRMCEAVGLVVTGLKRVRIGSVVLGKLPPGQWRYLRDDERF
ncbi:pseudouridine synthase [Scleromatobacter humisilvae]|uniref:Dual-specificity RNA pseudouridine synthase RluF n=1 Tax=Scleromatobacter humisilvae TaxID=2897159 RepID=A0A9X1YM64_9BURK|nr:pseudouridine synthase [Scleromatobacter humisilvae]MCK9688526.1 pseudouridine synthase [Scleromatobacter humisilvae]